MSVVVALAAKRTVIFAVPPPAMLPTGQETLVTPVAGTLGRQPVASAAELLTRSPIGELMFTALEKSTLRTTCVAVAPPMPDWFTNFVTESALALAVMKCGAASSVTHDAADGG